MARPLSPLIRYRSAFHLLAAVILSLAVLTAENTAFMTRTRSLILDASNYLYKPFGWLDTIFTLNQRYGELQQKYIAAQLEINKQKTLEEENQRLRNMLGFKGLREFDVIPANVLSNSGNVTLSSITIDQGFEDGVVRLAGVVDASAQLVGKVISVGGNTSIVQLVNDKNFRVSVREMRSRNVGILSYSPRGGYEIGDVPRNASVIAGDSVVTSGFSDIFPEHIFVGWVSDITPVIEDYVKSVKINLASDFNRLEEVFILKPHD